MLEREWYMVVPDPHKGEFTVMVGADEEAARELTTDVLMTELERRGYRVQNR